MKTEVGRGKNEGREMKREVDEGQKTRKGK